MIVWGGHSCPPCSNAASGIRKPGTVVPGQARTDDRVPQGWHKMRRPSMQIGLGIALGVGIGAAVAIVLGTGGVWLALGIAVGVIVGKTMSRTKQNEVHG